MIKRASLRLPSPWLRAAASAFMTVLLAACGRPDLANAPAPVKLEPGRPMPGQIVVHPSTPSWFAYEGGGPHYLAGAGDPEDFLYRGQLLPDGTRDGDQAAIIEKLRGTGVNGIYFQAIRSHGGDGEETHNPFIDHDSTRGLNFAVLDQWDQWFHALDDVDVVIYFFFYDDDVTVWDTGDDVSMAERTFFEAIVNRFEHHENLVWVVGEEYQEGLSVDRVSRLAAIIRAADDHDHVISVHKLSGLEFAEFADDANLDQFAIQHNVPSAEELHAGMLRAWQDAAGRYNLNMSESQEHGTGPEARRKHWAVAMAGAYVMVLYMDVIGTAIEDLRDLGRLRTFMESTSFFEMTPRDDLASAATQYVMARPGVSYILYSNAAAGGSRLGVRELPTGAYDLFWFDPVEGRRHRESVNIEGGTHAWLPPENWTGEVALYIRNTNRPGGPLPTGPDEVRSQKTATEEATVNSPPRVADQETTVQSGQSRRLSLSFEDPDGPGPYDFDIVTHPSNGSLTGAGNDLVYTPRPGFFGTDRFVWTVDDTLETSSPAVVTIHVKESKKASAGSE